MALEMLSEGFFTRIEDRGRFLLEGVALAARIHEIVVVAQAFRVGHPRPEMIDAEHLVPVSTPSLPPEAVDTTKRKLVAQPWFVRLLLVVAARAAIERAGI